MATWTPALLLALAAALGWSLFDLLRRLLTPRMVAWALVVWVTAAALPLVLAWAWIARDWRLGAGYLPPGLASVALNVAANFAYFRAFQLSPLSVTLPMLSLTPVFSALFGAAVLSEAVTARGAAGILAVVAGAYVLSTSRVGEGAERRLRIERGSVVMGAVALCWSATLLLDKLALRHASPPVHALVLNAGTAIGACAALAVGRQLGTLRGVRGSVGLLLLAVACGVGALGAQLVAIQSVSIGQVETLKRGVGGALAVVWGRAFFAEPVRARKLAAIALQAAGVAMLLLGRGAG